jgi:hypothetical protein
VTASTKSDWLIPAGLVALSIIPIAAGTSRIVQLGVGAEITPESARFFAAPLPLLNLPFIIFYVLALTVQTLYGPETGQPA